MYLAANISQKVFSEASVTGVSDSELIDLFEVCPNPTLDGILNIDADVNIDDSRIIVYDFM